MVGFDVWMKFGNPTSKSLWMKHRYCTYTNVTYWPSQHVMFHNLGYLAQLYSHFLHLYSFDTIHRAPCRYKHTLGTWSNLGHCQSDLNVTIIQASELRAVSHSWPMTMRKKYEIIVVMVSGPKTMIKRNPCRMLKTSVICHSVKWTKIGI